MRKKLDLILKNIGNKTKNLEKVKKVIKTQSSITENKMDNKITKEKTIRVK